MERPITLGAESLIFGTESGAMDSPEVKLPGRWRLGSESMMNEQKPGAKQLVLGTDSGQGRVHVDVEAFFGFSFWLAEELEDVVSRWIKKLPPRTLRPASRPRREIRRSAK